MNDFLKEERKREREEKNENWEMEGPMEIYYKFQSTFPDVLSENRTEYLPNTSNDCYRYPNPLV
jgi:hypothetical protein